MKRIPITLLTGFLGSGKTTVINCLVQTKEMARTLVIINEFGDVGLDHLLVTHSTEDVIVNMSSGCLCCTIRHDLKRKLRDITWRFAREGKQLFDRVLIETTGLADPTPIIHTLMTDEFIAKHYCLDGVVVTVDIATGLNTLDNHVESVKQAAVADVLLLTKSDITSLQTTDLLRARLTKINPGALQLLTHNGKITPDLILNLGLFNPLNKAENVIRWMNIESFQSIHDLHVDYEGHPYKHEHKHEHEHEHEHEHKHDVNRHDDHIRAFCFTLENPIKKDLLANWFELMQDFIGSNILRIKGILNVEGNDLPIVVHGVQHILYPFVSLPLWPSEDRRSHIVFITKDVSREVIVKTFNLFEQTQNTKIIV